MNEREERTEEEMQFWMDSCQEPEDGDRPPVKPKTCGSCEHGPHGDTDCPMGREHTTQDTEWCMPMAALTAARAEVKRAHAALRDREAKELEALALLDEARAESARWKRAAERLSRIHYPDACVHTVCPHRNRLSTGTFGVCSECRLAWALGDDP